MNILLQVQQTSDDTIGMIFLVTLLVLLLIYLGFCALVGKYAKNRGRSFWFFFIISIFLDPVVGFIIAALAGESNSYREERIRREVQIRLEEEQRYRQQFNQTPPPYNSTESDTSSID